MPLMQMKLSSVCRKTADPAFNSSAKSLSHKYFVSPEVSAKEQAEIFSKE